MKEQWYLLTDEGKKSLSFSLIVYLFIAIVILLAVYVIGNACGLPVPFPETFLSALFSFCCGLYGFRKHDKKKKAEKVEEEK